MRWSGKWDCVRGVWKNEIGSEWRGDVGNVSESEKYREQRDWNKE